MKSATPTGFVPPHGVYPHFSAPGHWVCPSSWHCPALCTCPKKASLSCSWLNTHFDGGRPQKQEDERVKGWLNAAPVTELLPQPLALYLVGAAGCAPSLWAVARWCSQTNRPDESSRAQTAAFPLQILFLDWLFSSPAHSFHKVCWNFLFCHLLPLHH